MKNFEIGKLIKCSDKYNFNYGLCNTNILLGLIINIKNNIIEIHWIINKRKYPSPIKLTKTYVMKYFEIL